MSMSFTSWEFWLLFACAFMASTWLHGARSKFAKTHAVRLRSGLLLAFSAGFYLLAAAPCAGILATSVLLNHGFGKLIHKLQGPARTWTTALGVTLNVLGLAAFKYAFFIDDTFGLELLTTGTFRLDAWMLPLGISFFTFQAISFLVDVHRRTLVTPPDLLSFATYLTFFPQLVAGPIVRATSFLPQLASPIWN
ncbi:MAG: MBOAT family O-acyltransferase, partial [Flavobacteriales bacterium]